MPDEPPLTMRQISQRARRDRERLIREQQHAIQVSARRSNGQTRRHALQIAANNSESVARRAYVEQQVQLLDLGQRSIECPHCHALHWMQEKIVNSSFANPRFGLCCDHGKVQLPLLPEPPAFLRQLLEGHDSLSKDFQTNIVQYNSSLAFTSLGVKQDRSINHGRGPPVFRIQGQLHHWSGSLLPAEGSDPVYAQLYFYDPISALNTRLQRNNNLNRLIMENLQDFLIRHNPFTAIYRHAFQILTDYNDIPDHAVRLQVLPGTDRRRYNLPTVNEVAAVIPENGLTTADGRDIILRLRDGRLQRIHEGHPAYSPLHYVLLFPFGSLGWCWDLLLHEPNKSRPGRLTQTRYAAFYLHDRIQAPFNTLLFSRQLFHRWLVDMWVSADQNRLNFLKNNQQVLRASVYNGLEDAVAEGDVNPNLNDIGSRYILPSSYVGGPRNMMQTCQDAMASARYFKRIDIFLTMTMNPNCRAVLDALPAGLTPADRPDIVARVFHLLQKDLIAEIHKRAIFGPCLAYIYSIEFQKRGLPHMHLLLFLDHTSQLSTPTAVDSAIRAYWPDPLAEPQLFNIVKSRMIHGPCGALNPSAPCMRNGKCSKNFPKPFSPRTKLSDNGYPEYYRPDDGRAYEVNGVYLDNRWVVPYNPWLLRRYDCHINVECAASFATVKYVMKYIHKGPDRSTFSIENRNEIQKYIDGRFVSAAESAWRIFHFEIHAQVPNVVRLQVHLPGQHMVIFNPNDDPQAILDRAQNEQTTLTAFFSMNRVEGVTGDLARSLTYQEFPQHFTFVAESPKHWKPREQGFALGRMFYIPPIAGDRFYLRLLLTAVKGPTSFEDIRTVKGITHNSYRDACLDLGLLDDDGEWKQCLQEACFMQTGYRLRVLFGTILMFCSPTIPEALWEEFRSSICDDLAYRVEQLGYDSPSEDDVYDYGLFLLEKHLAENGHSMAEIAPTMPRPHKLWSDQPLNPLIAEQTSYNAIDELRLSQEREATLTAEQQAAFNKVVTAVLSSTPSVFFLHGSGGTGKTYVYNTIASRIRGEGLIVLCVASSGIASLLLNGGRTSHSMFKIPIDTLTEDSHCSIPKQSLRADLLRAARLIIWDEVSMQHRWCIEALDRTLRDIRECDQAFGGLVTVLGGDFLQILPVIPKGAREEIVDATIQRSTLWQHIQVLHLSQNLRLNMASQSDREYADWLIQIGRGTNVDDNGTVTLPTSFIVRDITDFIHFVYPDVHNSHSFPSDYFSNRIILSARNTDVDELNEMVLQRLPGTITTCTSSNTIVHEAGADDGSTECVPEEYLRSLNPSGFPPGDLHLKPGCPVILLRNLAPSQGLCNGTRLIVQRISRRVIEGRIIGGSHAGQLAFIPRITLLPTSGKTASYSFTWKRRQFPVRLAFAISINKAQGQSVRYVGLDLRNPIFSHGQLYVALSRVTSSQHIRAMLGTDSNGSPLTRVENVVYPEVLLD